MLQRVMPELMSTKRVMILNDEARHCYREKPDAAEEGTPCAYRTDHQQKPGLLGFWGADVRRSEQKCPPWSTFGWQYGWQYSDQGPRGQSNELMSAVWARFPIHGTLSLPRRQGD